MEYTLIAYSGVYIDRNLDYDKIILSPKLLANIVNIENNNEVYIFKLTSINGKHTHCTVLEFISNDESIVYIPTRIMEQLDIHEGDQVNLSLILNTAPKPQKIVFKPIHNSFLQLNSHKEILENSLRNYSVVTNGDILIIDTQYKLEQLIVSNVYPETDYGCILNTNIEVEFEEAYITESKAPEENKEITTYAKRDISESKGTVNIDNLIECKNCHAYINNKSIQLHEVHCYRNYVYCNRCQCKISKIEITNHIHCSYCEVGLNKNDYQIHINNKHKKIKCEYCLKEILPNDLDSHLVDCDSLPIHCKWCGIKTPLNKIEEHENICSSKTTECEICGKIVILKWLDDHNVVDHDIRP